MENNMDKDLLSLEETAELIKKAKEGDQMAVNSLVEHNMRLVSSIAGKYVGSTSLEFQDLTQEGYFGLIKAIQKFDLSKGYRFSTYATWWVRQSIQRAIADNGRLIRIPVHIQEDIARVKKAKKILEQELNREPTFDDVYEKIKIDMSWYDKIVSHDFFEELVEVAINANAKELNSADITDIKAVIMEDLDFPEDAEIICNKIIKHINRNKSIPDKETVSERVNLSKKKIGEILSYDSSISSIDQQINDDMDNTIGDVIDSGVSVESDMDKKFLEEGLKQAIDEVYGGELLEIQNKIHKFTVQIDYLNSKLSEKSFDASKETDIVKDDDKLSEQDKKYILELLAKFSKKKTLNKTILSEEIETLTKKKNNEDRKSKVPKGELLMRRWGVCGYEKETLEQLGQRFSLSRERIRQLEKAIIEGNSESSRKLREKLLEYCNLSKEDFN